MPQSAGEILIVIIALVVILIFIALFMMMMLIYFNNRNLRNIREKENLKLHYEQALLESHLEVQENTMRQISQEIHDNVGQVLSLVNLNLNTLQHTDPEKVTHTSALLTKAILDLRHLSKSLDPENTLREGLGAAVRNELGLLEQSGRFKTIFKLDGEMQLQPGEKMVMYRMVQEVLNNIIKHSEATVVVAEMSGNFLSIRDNGKGFNPGQSKQGQGLNNLRQRSRAIGVVLALQTAPGTGTIITFKYS
ncbi:MAG TPA: ATP-binding protein [Chitinophagaceae bacterium]